MERRLCEAWISVIALLVTVLGWILVVVFGDFFKGYGAEKGKNVAIEENIGNLADQMRVHLKIFVDQARHEAGAKKEAEITAIQSKLDTVVEQNRAVVQSSEEIRRQVSGRQRIWELKREIANDILKMCGTVVHLFVVICSANKVLRDPSLSDTYRATIVSDLLSLNQRFDDSLEMLWQLEGTSQIVYDVQIAYELQRLANAGAVLHAVPLLPPDKEEQDRARSHVQVRVGIIQALQEQLKSDA